jgi:hypothetical protein
LQCTARPAPLWRLHYEPAQHASYSAHVPLLLCANVSSGAYDELLIRHCGRAAAHLSNFASYLQDPSDIKHAVASVGGPRNPYIPSQCPLMFNPNNPSWTSQQRTVLPRPILGLSEAARLRPSMSTTMLPHNALMSQSMMNMRRPNKFFGVVRMRGGYRAQYTHNKQLLS